MLLPFFSKEQKGTNELVVPIKNVVIMSYLCLS